MPSQLPKVGLKQRLQAACDNGIAVQIQKPALGGKGIREKQAQIGRAAAAVLRNAQCIGFLQQRTAFGKHQLTAIALHQRLQLFTAFIAHIFQQQIDGDALGGAIVFQKRGKGSPRIRGVVFIELIKHLPV